MKIKQLAKSASFLLVAGFISFTIPSCSSEEEIIILQDVKVNSESFNLAEDGSTTIEVKVVPENTPIAKAVLSTSLFNESSVFEVTRLTPKGNGVWQIAAKVKDFSRIQNGQDVILSVYQEDNMYIQTTLKINDPYSIEGKYTPVHPQAFTFYSAEDGKLMEIPFIITADNAADLAAISYDNIKVVNGTGSSTPSISITHFAIAPMTGKTGFYLQVDNAQLETVKKAITTIAFLDCRVMITGPNGRVAYTPVRLIVSSPKCIIKDDQLSLLHTELSAPEFNRQITIDMTHDFYRLGKQNDKTTFEAFENRGLYNSQGEMADADPQFISLGYTTQGKNTTCNVTLKHDATIPAIGTYHMVERLKGYWEYDGKKYPTVCTDLQFQITIK